jgi:hypothetical protein
MAALVEENASPASASVPDSCGFFGAPVRRRPASTVRPPAGAIAGGVNIETGERIFHANLTKVAGPSYAAWIAGYPGVGSQTGTNDDPDGDGMTNGEEYIAGTNPSVRTSVMEVSQMTPSGNDMIVSFPTSAGKLYRVERSDTLQSGSWTTVQDNIAGTGGTVQVTDTGGAAQPRRFYRVVVQ